MRYLYHQGGRNHGPVRFEQLRQLAEAGAIDNMTPILAEGAAAWSRWLFIKEQPPVEQKPAAPEPAGKTPSPKAAPAAPQAEKPATPTRPQVPAAAAAPKKTAPAPSAKPEAPVAVKSADARTPAPAAPARVFLLPYLPAALAAAVLLCSLGAALMWQLEAHDLQAQAEQRAAYARQQAEQRPELNTLQQQLQEQEAQKKQLAEELAANSAKLTELKQELAKLGSPGSGTGELDAKITQLRDKIKELDKQTADLAK